jgi:hypothetical protein
LSQAAIDLKDASRDEWYRGAIAEHQEPLVAVWNWIVESTKDGRRFTVQDVLDRFVAYPVVVDALRMFLGFIEAGPIDPYLRSTVERAKAVLALVDAPDRATEIGGVL